jgi:hypothetical protein
MMGVLGMYLDQTFTHAFFQGRGGVGGEKYCWNRCSSNFSFQNKFIIILPWGHQVEITYFQKCAFLKNGLLVTLMMIVIKPKEYFLIIIKLKAMDSLLWWLF